MDFLFWDQCFVWLGKDEGVGSVKKWAIFIWNRLTRILPVHYLLTAVILWENPSGTKWQALHTDKKEN